MTGHQRRPATGQLRRLRADEASGAARRAAESFGSQLDDAMVERWRARIERGEAWALDGGGEVLAHCLLLPSEHWFGGRRVPTLNVAGVVVPPRHRGRGVARELMQAGIAHGAREGFGLSLLFPATTGFYRKLGWEHAGTRARYRLATRHAPPVGPAMRDGDRTTDWPAIRACHEAATQAMQGPAKRPADRWEQLRTSAYRYVLDADDDPGTVIAYALVEHERPERDWRFRLSIVDWGATTGLGLQAIVGLIGAHRSFARDATFLAGAPLLWSSLLDEQDFEDAGTFYWMARGLDLGAAVAARGFPSALALAVTLRVEDPRLPWEPKPQRLEVAGGRGQLVPAQGADVRLDARAVGPLFTGFRTPAELALLGLLHGPDEALELLGAAFAGSPPVLFDFF